MPMLKKLIAPAMVVILLFSYALDALARPYRHREPSTLEQVLGGIILGGVLIKVFTTPSQPQIVPAQPSSTFIPEGMTFGTNNSGSVPAPSASISEASSEFPKILQILQNMTYRPIKYRPDQGYIDLVSESGRSRVVVTTQRQSLSTVPDIGKGDIQRRLSGAGNTLLFLNVGEMQFATAGGFQFFVYIVY